MLKLDERTAFETWWHRHGSQLALGIYSALFPIALLIGLTHN